MNPPLTCYKIYGPIFSLNLFVEDLFLNNTNYAFHNMRNCLVQHYSIHPIFSLVRFANFKIYRIRISDIFMLFHSRKLRSAVSIVTSVIRQHKMVDESQFGISATVKYLCFYLLRNRFLLQLVLILKIKKKSYKTLVIPSGNP